MRGIFVFASAFGFVRRSLRVPLLTYPARAMPTLSPFRPLRFNPEFFSNLGLLISPPYDVIGPALREQLAEQAPFNIVRLILPAGSQPYAEASQLLADWKQSGVVVQDPQEAIYPYRQTFTHPQTNQRIVRTGFMATLRLAPFSAGEILPHERTLSGPKQDRLRLMLATHANLEPIFGIYADPAGATTAVLNAATKQELPTIDAMDSEGIRHEVWQMTEAETIQQLKTHLQGNPAFIVDGHHRYETALRYQELAREGSNEPIGALPCDWIMIFLAPMNDPGLLILPTHRLVHSLPTFNFGQVLEQLREDFLVTTPVAPADGLALLQQHESRPSYLLSDGNVCAVVVAKDSETATRLTSPENPAAVRSLDVSLLHDHLFERLLGITQQQQLEQTNLRYVKNATEALAAPGTNGVQLAVLMNPTRLEQVVEVATSGGVMPQKSTFFYPKLASGLLMNPLG